jgi:hypothetical protein
MMPCSKACPAALNRCEGAEDIIRAYVKAQQIYLKTILIRIPLNHHVARTDMNDPPARRDMRCIRGSKSDTWLSPKINVLECQMYGLLVNIVDDDGWLAINGV